jgi:hypothetical protein
MKLDVMPTDEKVLGFKNRWYQAAIEAAQEMELEPGFTIRVITAPYFIATKLDAFRDRGKGNYTSSHDLEDLLTVVDGRASMVEEITSSAELHPYIAEQFSNLLQTKEFLDALPGYLLPDPITGMIREQGEAELRGSHTGVPTRSSRCTSSGLGPRAQNRPTSRSPREMAPYRGIQDHIVYF